MEADFSRYHGLRLVDAAFGPGQLSRPELRSYIEHLPPDSAYARTRAQLAGEAPQTEWFQAAQLSMLHAIYDVSVRAATRGKGKARPLAEMLNLVRRTRAERPAPKGEKPRTFRQWFAALGRFTAGVPEPPERPERG